MANGVFNIAKGRVNEFVERVESDDPATSRLQIKLLKVGHEADGTLEDYDTFAALLTGSNDECDFTNYGTGITLDKTDLSRTVDDTGNTQYSTCIDQTISSAGGATNNTTGKVIICYDELGTDVDANLIPLTHHDFDATTDGNDLVLDFGTYFYSAG